VFDVFVDVRDQAEFHFLECLPHAMSLSCVRRVTASAFDQRAVRLLAVFKASVWLFKVAISGTGGTVC